MGIQKGERPKTPPPEDPKVTALTTVVEEDQSMNKLLRIAVEKIEGAGAESAVATLKELADLKLKLERVEAKKEFNNAMAEFQTECPQIPKTKSTQGASSAGGKFGFMYAPLDVVEKTIKPHLYPKGFSYYWDGETTLTEGKYLRTETCYLLHRNGHQIKSSLSAPVTKEIGSMNEIQRHGAIQAYLKRYTLLAVLGVPTADVDTDAVSPETIDEKEIIILKSKLKIKGADEKRFFEYMDVKDYAEIRKVDLSKAALALDMYEKKEKPAGKAAKKPEPAKKAAVPAAGTSLQGLREKAYTTLKKAIDIKAKGYKPPTRSKWEPLINNAKTPEAIDKLISNLTAFIDEAGSDGKLKL